jgi:iron complex outermembrane recepter protein
MLRFVTAMSVATVFAFPAMAQEQSSETAPIQEVMVTGSRIPQAGLQSVSPITTISSEEVRLQGTTTAETLLNSLPQVFPGQSQTFNSGATGIATVDLRALNPVRTLVLVDGKRLMPGDPTLPVADINAIPASLIERVEVVTGGASAVYGSDAIAGVVNFKLKRDLDGVLFDAQYGFYQHDNDYDDAHRALADKGFAQPAGSVTTGDNYLVSAAFGNNFADGAGNVTAYAVYREASSVFQREYDFSACALSGETAPRTCGGSSNYNRFIVQNAALPGTTPVRDFFALTDGTIRPYDGTTDLYNFTPINYFARPNERYQLGAFAHYEVRPEVELYTDVMMTADRSIYQIAESALFLGTGPSNGEILVSCDSALLTDDHRQKLCTNFGLSGSDQVRLLVGRRAVEAGPRFYNLKHDALRLVAGARGAPLDGWTYDVYGQYGRTDYLQRQNGQLSRSRVINALDIVNDNGVARCRSAVNGTDPACVPLDLLGGLGAWTPQMINYITTDSFQTGETTEKIASASIAGDLGEYGIKLPWAQDSVGVAFGYEYRDERLSYNPSSTDKTGDVFGGSTLVELPESGFSVNELYGEVRVPLVQGVKFVDSLTFEGGYRTSDYSSAGKADTYKLALSWAPISDVRLRASYQQAVRAPNVIELFSPQLGGNYTGTDPCAGPSPTASLEKCMLTGVTAAQYGLITECPAGLCTSIGGGNPALAPEDATSFTYGVIFRPSALPGFNAVVDFYDIEVTNVVGQIGAATIVNQCLATGDPLYCARIRRNPNGLLFGGSNNDVGVFDINANLGFLRARGVDVEASYPLELADLGSVGLSFVGSYTKSFETEGLPGAGSYDCAGLFGTVCGVPHPRWQHALRATWDVPADFDVSLNWRYIKGTTFDGNVVGDPFLSQGTDADNISDYNYFDLSGAYTYKSATLRVGVNNIFDKTPPVFDGNVNTNQNGNTYPQRYDGLGRTIFFAVSTQF